MLGAQKEPVAEFDEQLWGCIVDYVTVSVDGDMRRYFGMEQRFNFYITLAGISKDVQNVAIKSNMIFRYNLFIVTGQLSFME